jgi:hypothetical protein
VKQNVAWYLANKPQEVVLEEEEEELIEEKEEEIAVPS